MALLQTRWLGTVSVLMWFNITHSVHWLWQQLIWKWTGTLSFSINEEVTTVAFFLNEQNQRYIVAFVRSLHSLRSHDPPNPASDWLIQLKHTVWGNVMAVMTYLSLEKVGLNSLLTTHWFFVFVKEYLHLYKAAWLFQIEKCDIKVSYGLSTVLLC